MSRCPANSPRSPGLAPASLICLSNSSCCGTDEPIDLISDRFRNIERLKFVAVDEFGQRVGRLTVLLLEHQGVAEAAQVEIRLIVVGDLHPKVAEIAVPRKELVSVLRRLDIAHPFGV